MKKFRAALPALALAAAFAALLRFPQEVSAAVTEGLRLSVSVLIPSLFPFFICVNLTSALGLTGVLARVFAPVMRQMFHVSGAGCTAVLCGAAGGYPSGAQCVAALYREGQLSRAEAEYLLLFCNNAGPAFILGIAGSGVFQSARAGMWLYLIHAAAATAVGLVFCFIRKCIMKPETSCFVQVSGTSCNFPAAGRRKPSPSPAAAFIGAVRGGVTAMAGVCGFVIFFLVVLRLAESFLGMLLPIAAGFVELTNGILRLTADRAGFISAAALLGWGGLSVHCQTAAVLGGSGVSLRWYLPAKAAQALLSAAMAAAVWHWAL